MFESSSASNPVQLLQEVGRILESERISWAAIGALAVAYHGVVRASLDADAAISLKGSATDIDALVRRLRKAGWKVELNLGEEGDPLAFVVRLTDKKKNRVD